MPPRRRLSAPANRVYKSATPMQQTKLPTQKKRVKSYGKKTTRLAKEDNTLTQIGFVQLNDRPEVEQEEGDQGSDYEEASEKRKKKRRKTTGDQPSPPPQWHTQTITQLDWSFSTTEDAEEDHSMFDMPSSSQSLHLPTNVQRLPGLANNARPSRREASPNLDIPPPRTPQRVIRQEVPSSQSPATPLSVQSGGSARQRSPLKEKSINVPIPFDTNGRSQSDQKTLPKVKIEDTFDSGNNTSQPGDVPSSPTKRSSPAKSVRLAIPEEEEGVETPATPSIKKESTPYPSRQKTTEKPVKLEIFDSDAEDEEVEGVEAVGEVEEAEASKELEPQQPAPSASMPQEQYDEEPETFYGEIGRDTQLEADRVLSSSLADASTNDAPVHEAEAEQTASGETQVGETQRISTRHVTSMAPRTANSDIFISINPQHVTNIINRLKNHEMRNWAFPPNVCRVWIYETKPVSALKYMAEISPAKKPGEILDQAGLGNAAFNTKPRDSSWNAYEIMQLYELANPLTLSEIISNGWMKAAPQRFAWVRPAVADELIANLKPPLFNNAFEDGPTSSSTDTQEAEEQLLSTIRQFTQPALPVEPASSSAVRANTGIIKPPSSAVHHETPGRPSSPPRPSQAETVDLSQGQTARHPSQELEIVWESPARPVASSTPLKLPARRSGGSERHGPDSIVPYSMSSQFLSKSQLLPESLLNEEIPGPPRFIQDSDDEDEL